MRILTVLGARPQFVKAAPVSRALRPRHEEIVVHTGQHYDDAMSEVFFRDLEMAPPDVNLEVGSGTHATMTARIMERLEPVILEHEPDALLIYGDTNSTFAAAAVGCKIEYAGRARPWTAHVEAGLRSFNPAMPEERNRVAADHLCELLLAPTPAAVANLEREGLGSRTRLVGDVMVDSHAWASERAAAALPPAAADAAATGYVLLTLHRAENVDDPARLASLLAAFEGARPVLFPIHPRTRGALDTAGIALPENVVALDPVGYLAMVALERHAALIATDSGGVQKEAYLSGVPCLTLRNETEWVETVEAGWNSVVGTSADAVRAGLNDAETNRRDHPRPPVFGDARAAGRIVEALEEYAS